MLIIISKFCLPPHNLQFHTKQSDKYLFCSFFGAISKQKVIARSGLFILLTGFCLLQRLSSEEQSGSYAGIRVSVIQTGLRYQWAPYEIETDMFTFYGWLH